MPYYIYRMGPFGQLHKLAEFPAFKPASAFAKELRNAPGTPPQGRIRVMFANTELLAEELLCQVREPGPLGDE